MKIKYLLDNNYTIIALQYEIIHDETSKTGYDLVADGVEVPINSIYQELEIDDINKVHLGFSQVIDGTFYENLNAYNSHLEEVKKAEEKQAVIDSYKQEMASIKNWLNANDYIINKHTLGEYTDTDLRWVNYLAERKVKLERYNELEEKIYG